jgi:pyruvate/2-oxoglutarate dehydrogenase complex dihydrolipoamide dehydrogenase (E3) component
LAGIYRDLHDFTAPLPDHVLHWELTHAAVSLVGGSYIGLEFAQMYRRFGAAVTVVEVGPPLIGREDEDVSQAIRDILEQEGIAIRTGAECTSLAPHIAGMTNR